MLPLFVSCHKLPQPRWLKTTQVHSLDVLEVRSPQGVVLAQVSRGTRPGPSGGSRESPWPCLPPLGVTCIPGFVPSSRHASLLFPSSHLLLPPVTFLLPLIRTRNNNNCTHVDNPAYSPHLKVLHFITSEDVPLPFNVNSHNSRD